MLTLFLETETSKNSRLFPDECILLCWNNFMFIAAHYGNKKYVSYSFLDIKTKFWLSRIISASNNWKYNYLLMLPDSCIHFIYDVRICKLYTKYFFHYTKISKTLHFSVSLRVAPVKLISGLCTSGTFTLFFQICFHHPWPLDMQKKLYNTWTLIHTTSTILCHNGDEVY
jgi:hypothetical protein